MITPHDLQHLAARLVGRHGAVASHIAESAVKELEACGEFQRAEAWRALQSIVEDMLLHRLSREKLTIH